MSNTEKPSKKAAALKYDPDRDSAPVVTAVGSGYVAEKILEKAAEHDIPVVEDAGVANVLSRFSAGDAIPGELYEAVAQILVFIAETDSAYREKISNTKK